MTPLNWLIMIPILFARFASKNRIFSSDAGTAEDDAGLDDGLPEELPAVASFSFGTANNASISLVSSLTFVHSIFCQTVPSLVSFENFFYQKSFPNLEVCLVEAWASEFSSFCMWKRLRQLQRLSFSNHHS